MGVDIAKAVETAPSQQDGMPFKINKYMYVEIEGDNLPDRQKRSVR